MKINLISTRGQRNRSPYELDIGGGCYIDLYANADSRRRIEAGLVLREGALYLDYDGLGWLVGVEINMEDHFPNRTINQMFQPKNPLK